MDGPGTAAAAADPSSALANAAGADAAGSPAGCGGGGRLTVEPGHPGVETTTAAADGGDDAVGAEGTGPFASPPPPPPLPSAAAATASHEDHPYDTHPNGSGLEHKTGKIKQIVEEAISPESKQMVLKILEQVNQLSMIEKLYLYLKLPTGKTTPVDPLRQHLNPLGSRFEIQQTITWIKTHLEEDPEVSLPKQDVYDEYLAYCSQNKMKHLSNADFGKVMKQVFPCVRPRRLGTRGNSRYCYSGMRKRMKLHAPLLPDLGEHKISSPHSEDEVVSAASSLIREWAEKLLSVRFDSLRDLAYHLVEKMCVDSRSVAAFTLLSVNSGKCNGKEVTSPLGLPSGHLGATNRHMEAQMQLQRKLKEREMIREQKRKMQDQQQLQHQQLQQHHNSAALGKVSAFEKLKPSKRAKIAHFKERRGMPTAAPSQSDAASHASGLFAGEQWDAIKFEDCATTKAASLGRRGKSASVDSIATTSDSLQLRQVMTASVPVVSCGEPKENEDIFVPVQQIPNVLPLPSSTCIQDKLPIPRMVNNNNNNNSRANSKPLVSAHKPDIIMPNQKLSLVLRKKFYKPIQPKPDKQKLTSKDCNETYDTGNRSSLAEEQSNRTEEITTNPVKVEIDSGHHVEENVNHENDPLSDYFHGGHNSQEQEEELVRYFQHQTSSSSTEELEEVLMPCRSATADPTKSDQLSQLRLLLERNLTNATAARNLNARQVSVPSCPVTSMGQILTEDSGASDDVFLPGPGLTIPPGASASVSLSLLSQRNQQKQQQQQRQSTQPLPMLQVNEPKSGLIPSLLPNSSNNSGLSVRRRVSFETSVTEHYQSDNCFQHAVPPSPNTRRKFFNFTPISAGPHSPLGQRPSASSKPSSANASPFVSPRNTPVPRNRHISSFPSVQQSSQLSGRLRIPPKVVRSNSVTGGLHTTPFPLTRPRPLSTTTPLLHSDNPQLPLQSKGLNCLQNTLDPQVLVNNQHSNVQLSLSLASASPMSLSAPHSPMISASSITPSVNCSAEEAPEYMNSDLLISKMLNHEKMSQQFNNGVDSNFFPSAVGSNLHVQQMLTPTKQMNRLQNVAQPTQIPPLPTPDPLAHEVSQFFSDDVVDRSRQAVQQQQFQYRSQSVPLHRMLSTSDLISPHYTVPHSVDSNLQMNQFSLSATSSVAPTPVPSECMDFTSVTDNSSAGQGVNLLIDETDPETATLNSENLDRIFNILDDVQEQDKQLQQLQQQQEELQQQNEQEQQQQEQQQCQRLLLKHQEPLGKEHRHPHQQIGLTLDLVAADNVNGDFLDLPCSQTRSGIHSSRSYPNTPVPHKCTNVRDPLVTSLCMPSSNLDNSPSTLGSRSLPPTPLLSILDDEVTPFQSIVDRDPMLTLNALNSRLSEEGNNYVARRNMHSLLEESLTLDALDLQECDSFSQLTEVESAVHDT